MLRRLIRPAAARESSSVHPSTVLDGMTAVAITEARISQAAGLGATFPASISARAWSRYVEQGTSNEFDLPISAMETDSPRAALATALGLSMSGQRAVVFLSGPDLSASHDLLSMASGHHLPLVVHLSCRATPGHAQAIGSGHQAFYAAADCGCFQLFATNVQEAVDLALIARRVAERALVPGIVAMDAEQTASAAQDVILPDADLIMQYLDDPAGAVDTPTDAQRLIFGDTRRLVPRSFDLDRPTMCSPLQGPESFALGAAGNRPYFCDHLQSILEEALEEFGTLTGRQYEGVLAHETKHAEIVLVVQGSAVETAIAFADDHNRRQRVKIGVLGVRALRPIPAEEVVRHLSGRRIVVVLERTDTPLAGDGPLLREMRLAFARAAERARQGEARPVQEKDLPRFVNVPFGVGGLPLRAADLDALIGRVSSSNQPVLYLGLDFARSSSIYPKQQAAMDALRRSYEGLEELGVRGDDSPPDVRPKDAVTIAFHRPAGCERESLAGDAAALAHELLGGHLRSRPAVSWERFDAPTVDVLTHASEDLRDPGDDVPVDIAVVATGQIDPRMRVTDRLVSGGMVLMAIDDRPAAIPARVRRELTDRNIAVHAVSVSPTHDQGRIDRSRLSVVLNLLRKSISLR